jgi:N-acetylneuraminate synthase
MKFIAEVGINHNGSLETAKELITMAKGCGAHAVKFQKRTIDKVYSKEFLDGPRESPWGTTQREQKMGLEFTADDYDKIDAFCKQLDITWFASAWDIDSLIFLERFAPKYHKVASAFITNDKFLHAVAELNRTTFISTGMCEFSDILNAVNIFNAHNCPYILMHCVSLYPCPDELCNISMIPKLKGAFPAVRIGYSGHERGIMPSLAAVAFGAKYIERHITLDRTMYGSDQAASLEAPGIVRLIEYAKQIETCLGDGIKVFSEQERKVAKSLRYWK